MSILKRIQLASKGISLVTCLWLAYFAFSYYKTGDENNLLVGGLSILAFIIILVARSIFGGNKVKMPVEDHEGFGYLKPRLMSNSSQLANLVTIQKQGWLEVKQLCLMS